MNALDKAFIKAFAKDGSSALVRSTNATVERSQPSVSNVESTALEGEGASTRGVRLRLDRPIYPTPVLQATHMNLPVVEHVESYELADIPTATLPQVVVEDRLQGLDTPAKPVGPQSKSHARSKGTSRTKTPAQPRFERVVAWASPDLVRPDLMLVTSDHLNWAHAGSLRTVATHVELGWHTPAVRASNAPATGQSSVRELIVRVPSASPPALIVVEESPSPSLKAPADEERATADRGLTPAETALLLEGVAPSVAPSFVPAWEVDSFRWPELCTELDLASGTKVSQSGEELHTASQDGLRVVAIVGTAREEGRSTLALALVRAAAAAGCRVAIVDADGANPELARRLGLESPCDWLDALTHAAPLSEAAVASIADGVTLFPLTGPHDALSSRLDDPTLTAAIRELKAHFDLVVVDTQPLQLNAARVPIVPLPCEIDLAVLVRNNQATPMDDCLAAAEHLRATGVRAIGIAENFVGRF